MGQDEWAGAVWLCALVGLLPGVLRAHLGCPEEVLLVRDLPDVRLWVSNPLRGLIAAEWVG